jgi:hypothetical protein
MSVASMAGYLANSGGGGGQSSYYKDFNLSGPTTITQSGDPTTLFDIPVPSAGTYLITTFLTLQSYVLNGEEYDTAAYINTADIAVIYNDNAPTVINNQTFLSGSTTAQCIIQTSGIFVSTGTGSLLISVNIAVTGDASHYNVILNDEFTPQVQIASIITGSGGGGGDGTFDIVTIGDTNTVELSCNDTGVLDVNNLITYTVNLVSESDAEVNVILSCEDNKVLNVPNISVTETGITFPDGKTQTIAYEGGGDAITLTAGAGIGITEEPQNTYTITNTGAGAEITLVQGAGIGIVEEPLNTYTISNTGGGGDVNTLTQGAGIVITPGENGDYTIANDGVLALTQGTGIEITGSKDNYTITNTINAADFLTTAAASNTYETITNANTTFETKTAAAAAFQPIGNYITSPYSNYMFFATYSTPTTFTPGTFKQIVFSPNPSFGYNSTETFEIIAVPVYSQGSLPMTVFSITYGQSGSNKGAVYIDIQNNNDVSSTVNSVIAYAFRII